MEEGGELLTVWLFSMNWTAVSFTSFLTLLYVQGGRQGTSWERTLHLTKQQSSTTRHDNSTTEKMLTVTLNTWLNVSIFGTGWVRISNGEVI